MARIKAPPSNLMRQSGSPYFYAVLNVPEDVRPILKRTSFRQSLKTSDRKEAAYLAHGLVKGWKAQIALVRARSGEHFSENLDEISDRIQKLRETLSAVQNVEDYISNPAFSELQATEDMLQERIIAQHGTSPFENLNSDAQAEVLKKYKLASGQEVPFDRFVNKYLNWASVAEKTKGSKRQQISRYVAQWPNFSDATRSNVRKYTRHLRDLHNLSNASIKRDLSTLSVYWEFVRDEMLVDLDEVANPFIGQKLPSHSSATGSIERQPFSKLDLEKIYLELLKSSVSGSEQDVVLLDMFLVAIFTGARREEIGQLKFEDVHIDHDVPYISISNAKTVAGIRSVPIHPNILDMLNARLLRGQRAGNFIFRELQSSKNGSRTDAIGKRFGRLKTSLGYNEQFVFHSIRKSVATFLEQANVPEGITADILGHEKATITYGLYSGGTSLTQKLKAIDALEYSFIQ